MALLSFSAASGAAIGTQFCAAIAYTVGMFAIIEIPLVAYLVKPEQTQAIMLSVSNWLRAHRRRVLVVIGGTAGIVLVASGMSSM
jgi:Sap, sulfolipid-1-addressing protein